MKKLFSMLVMLLLALPALQAQGRHELNLGFGAVSGEYALLDTNEGSGSDLCGLYEPHYSLERGPVLSLDYHFKLNKVVYLGAEVDYSNVLGRSWYNIGGRKGQSFRTDIFAFMPQVKLRIPGAAHFRLYGKAAMGVRFVLTDLEDELNSSFPVHFAWDITPIGFEWGGNTVYGMAELCVGNVLMGGRIGIGFRF